MIGTQSVVLLSGGLDSSVALAWAASTGRRPVALSVHYGQRHERELRSAASVASLFGVAHEVRRLEFPWAIAQGSPVLPGRNLVLLTLAAAYGASRYAGDIEVIIGACAADAAGFPDCRPRFLKAASDALSAGFDRKVEVVAPFVDRTKAQILLIAQKLDAWAAVAASWSCYEGGEHPCGRCGACRYRAEGFAEIRKEDPCLAP